MKKQNLNRIPRTIAEVNKAIAVKFPEVKLAKGNGYFWIYSDNKEVGLKIAGLFTSSIYVNSLGQQSIDKWVKDVDTLMSKIDNDIDQDGLNIQLRIK